MGLPRESLGMLNEYVEKSERLYLGKLMNVKFLCVRKSGEVFVPEETGGHAFLVLRKLG